MRLVREEALALYEILDNEIGVFRPKKADLASENEADFYFKKKEEFLDTFTRKIPKSFWFQGGYHSSITLMCDTTGLYIDLDSLKHKNTIEAGKRVNRKIKDRRFKLIA